MRTWMDFQVSRRDIAQDGSHFLRIKQMLCNGLWRKKGILGWGRKESTLRGQENTRPAQRIALCDVVKLEVKGLIWVWGKAGNGLTGLRLKKPRKFSIAMQWNNNGIPARRPALQENIRGCGMIHCWEMFRLEEVFRHHKKGDFLDSRRKEKLFWIWEESSKTLQDFWVSFEWFQVNLFWWKRMWLNSYSNTL